jgi:hypothetical protein
MKARLPAVLVVILPLVASVGCGSSPANPSPYVTISQVQPAAAAIGATVVVQGSGFSTADNTVKFGSGYLGASVAATSATALQFALPSYLSPCPPGPLFCQTTVIIVRPGPYELTVTNPSGTSNTVTVQVLAQ